MVNIFESFLLLQLAACKQDNFNGSSEALRTSESLGFVHTPCATATLHLSDPPLFHELLTREFECRSTT